MNIQDERNEGADESSIDISHFPFMSGLCRTGPEARLLREKMANVDFSIPEEVLARLKMGQETVE